MTDLNSTFVDVSRTTLRCPLFDLEPEFFEFGTDTPGLGCEPSGNMTVVNWEGIRSYLKIN